LCTAEQHRFTRTARKKLCQSGRAEPADKFRFVSGHDLKQFAEKNEFNHKFRKGIASAMP
jgi:hypothetical protein